MGTHQTKGVIFREIDTDKPTIIVNKKRSPRCTVTKWTEQVFYVFQFFPDIIDGRTFYELSNPNSVFPGQEFSIRKKLIESNKDAKDSSPIITQIYSINMRLSHSHNPFPMEVVVTVSQMFRVIYNTEILEFGKINSLYTNIIVHFLDILKIVTPIFQIKILPKNISSINPSSSTSFGLFTSDDEIYLKKLLLFCSIFHASCAWRGDEKITDHKSLDLLLPAELMMSRTEILDLMKRIPKDKNAPIYTKKIFRRMKKYYQLTTEQTKILVTNDNSSDFQRLLELYLPIIESLLENGIYEINTSSDPSFDIATDLYRTSKSEMNDDEKCLSISLEIDMISIEVTK